MLKNRIINVICMRWSIFKLLIFPTEVRESIHIVPYYRDVSNLVDFKHCSASFLKAGSVVVLRSTEWDPDTCRPSSTWRLRTQTSWRSEVFLHSLLHLFCSFRMGSYNVQDPTNFSKSASQDLAWKFPDPCSEIPPAKFRLMPGTATWMPIPRCNRGSFQHDYLMVFEILDGPGRRMSDLRVSRHREHTFLVATFLFLPLLPPSTLGIRWILAHSWRAVVCTTVPSFVLQVGDTLKAW